MALKLDDTDMQLLSLLEKDSKARMHVLSRRLSIPASTVHHRIKRLEAGGIIRSYGIKKDFREMGMKLKAHVMVFIDVTMLKRMKKSQKELARQIRCIEGVEAVDIITGDADLIVTVRCRDIDDFQKFLLEHLQAIEGITETKSMIVVAEE
jgi:DNA-binding Lrp family transcriptional regulator